MKTRSKPLLPSPGSDIRTACGGLAKFAPDSPRALDKDNWVFFCLPTCLQEFEQNPVTSCYAAQMVHQGKD